MLTKYIKEGDRIEIRKREMDEEISGYDNKVLWSRVFEIESEEKLLITMPMEKTKLILIPVGSVLDLCFYTANGLYQCFARVAERYKSSNVYILVMELETNLRKHQRREYYRLNCVIQMKCRILSDDEFELPPEEVEFVNMDIALSNGVIVDISGGGVRFISSEVYEVGSLIMFLFDLDLNGDIKQYTIVGKILRSDPVQNRDSQYENRVQFENISQEDREGIIKYIFEEERRNRRREKR